MEGFGLGAMIDELQERLIFGELRCYYLTYCHDHDSSASVLVKSKQDKFLKDQPLLEVDGVQVPLIVPLDLHDRNHAAVNFGKKVTNIWTGFGAQASRAFEKTCNKRDLSIDDRIQILRNYPNHWAGIHNNCLGCNTGGRSLINLEKPEHKIKYELLCKLFDKQAESLPQYVHNASTNGNESFNNQLTVTAPKRKDYKKTYKGRVDFALLRHNEGDACATMTALKQLDLDVSSSTARVLEKIDLRKAQNKIRQQTPAYKSRRRENKDNNAELHSSVSHGHSYKNFEGERPKKKRRTLQQGTVAVVQEVGTETTKKKRKTPVCKKCSQPATKEFHDYKGKGQRICRING
ncbi:hypothetical protein AKO1_011398, partial [Acrasis kona]